MAYKKAPINIDGRTFHSSRIKLVGVELEGAWSDLPPGVVAVDSINPGPNQLGRDGSIKTQAGTVVDEELAKLDPVKFPYIGEIPSPALRESEIGAWLQSHYPGAVGPKCGLHIHISVTNPLIYMWLMDDESYPATVVEYLRRWAIHEQIPKDDAIWDRLAGNCKHCKLIHWPAEQVKQRHKDYDKDRKGNRYTALAFHYFRDGLGTIECRLLSMPKDVSQAQRAVQEFCSITNRYLVATAKREVKRAANVIVDSPAYELTLNLNV